MIVKELRVQDADKRYISALEKTRLSMEKNINVFMEKYDKRVLSIEPSLLSLPHPMRIKYLGVLPPHFELGAFESERVATITMYELCSKEMQIGRMLTTMTEKYPEVREAAVFLNAKEATSNLGGLCLPMFFHRFMAKGQHFYRIDPALMANKLPERKITLSNITLPSRCIYVECRDEDFAVFNEESGNHVLEGFYINQSIWEEHEVLSDEALKKQKGNEGNLISFLIEAGYIKENGGKISVFEIMLTGSPLGKKSITDDATFSFNFAIQEDVSDLAEGIRLHQEYFSNDGENGSRVSSVFLKGDIKRRPFFEHERKMYSEGLSLINRVLSYLSDENVVKEVRLEEDALEARIRRERNLVTQRKLEKLIPFTVNYTVLKPKD